MNAISLLIAAAAPLFVTPDMMYRRGLTDAQYEHLWKIGRNPQVEPAAMREWIFKSSRYENTTNWLNIVGQTNDFAKLSYTLQDENFKLEETNAVLVATNSALTATCVRLAEDVATLFAGYTNQLAQTAAYSNAYVIAQGVAQAANAKIQDEIADLQAKIVKYQEWQKKYPIAKSIFAGLITDAENRIRILQALTGGAE